MKENRSKEFQRDLGYDELLIELNSVIEEISFETEHKADLQVPAVFLVGPPRSGTTLLMQCLAESNRFAYPSNLIARFFSNVVFGQRVSSLLAPVLESSTSTYESNLGRTNDWNGPSEFGFFWSRFFPLEEHHEPDEEQLNPRLLEAFTNEIRSWSREAQRPVLLKAVIMNYQVRLLFRLFPDAVFIRTRRSYPELVRSISEGRQRFVGSSNSWFSCRPKNWKEINDIEDPVEKTVAQLASIEQSISDGWEHIPAKSKIVFTYEEFCDAPHRWLKNFQKIVHGKLDLAKIPNQFPVKTSLGEDRSLLDLLHKYGLSE